MERVNRFVGGADMAADTLLAFLAGLGVLSCLEEAAPGARMLWVHDSSMWLPAWEAEVDDLCAAVARVLLARKPFWSEEDVHIAKAGVYRRVAEAAVGRSRRDADLVACIGSDNGVPAPKKARRQGNEDATPEIQQPGTAAVFSPLVIANGAQNRMFLSVVAKLYQRWADTDEGLRRLAADIGQVLFGTWEPESGSGMSLGLWPEERRDRATFPGDPSKSRLPVMTLVAANRLAVEGYTLLPCVPVAREQVSAACTVWKGRRGKTLYARWPVWVDPIPADVVRTLLVGPDLLGAELDEKTLRARRVAAVYEAPIAIGEKGVREVQVASLLYEDPDLVPTRVEAV